MQYNNNEDETNNTNYRNIANLPGITELLRHWRNIGSSRRTGALPTDTSIEAQNCFLECFINKIPVQHQDPLLYNTEYLKCWLNDSLMTTENDGSPVQNIPNSNNTTATTHNPTPPTNNEIPFARSANITRKNNTSNIYLSTTTTNDGNRQTNDNLVTTHSTTKIVKKKPVPMSCNNYNLLPLTTGICSFTQ
jgi:hypothetical protein